MAEGSEETARAVEGKEEENQLSSSQLGPLNPEGEMGAEGATPAATHGGELLESIMTSRNEESHRHRRPPTTTHHRNNPSYCTHTWDHSLFTRADDEEEEGSAQSPISQELWGVMFPNTEEPYRYVRSIGVQAGGTDDDEAGAGEQSPPPPPPRPPRPSRPTPLRACGGVTQSPIGGENGGSLQHHRCGTPAPPPPRQMTRPEPIGSPPPRPAYDGAVGYENSELALYHQFLVQSFEIEERRRERVSDVLARMRNQPWEEYFRHRDRDDSEEGGESRRRSE